MISFGRTSAFRRFLAQAAGSVGLAYYALYLGPKGWGRPSRPETVDDQYRSGHWDRFETIEEMPRYAILAGLIRRLKPMSAVLDVGCGYGTLGAELDSRSMGSYVGIDHSSEAIKRAVSQELPNCHFEVADFTTWRPDGQYDFIVFNDTAYYAERPVDLVMRFAKMLTTDGLLLVAMFRHRNTPIIWNGLTKHLETLYSFEVKSSNGEVTDIRVLARAE